MDVRHMMTILIMLIVDPILMYCKVLMITNTNVIVNMFVCECVATQVPDTVSNTFALLGQQCLEQFPRGADQQGLMKIS